MQVAVIATIAAITVGLIVGNTMPVVIGSLVLGSDSSASLAGLIVTAEFSASAVAALLLSPFMGRLSPIGLALGGSALAALGQTVSGIMMPIAPHEVAPFVGVRILTGLGAGLVLASANACLARLPNPPRAYAIAALVSALASAVILAGLPMIQQAYPFAGYGVLAATMAIPALSYFFLPRPEGVDAQKRVVRLDWLLRAPPLLILAGGAAMALGLGALWPFIEVLGLAQGLTREAIGRTISVNMIAGLLGSAVAAVIGARFGVRGPWFLCAGGLAIAPILLANAFNEVSFGAIQALYGVSYFTAMTYLFSIGAARDAEGRVSAALGGVFLIGTGVGPALGGWIADHLGADAIGISASALLCLAVILVGLGAPIDPRLDALKPAATKLGAERKKT
jgi:MFS family permease